jgi:hypothetical protein
MLIFTLPFVAFAAYKIRFAALGFAAVMGLAIGVPWDLISAARALFSHMVLEHKHDCGYMARTLAARRISVHGIGSNNAH